MHKIFLKSILLAALLSGCVTTPTTTVDPAVFAEQEQQNAAPARGLEEGSVIELSVEVDGTMEVQFHRASLNNQGVVTLPLVGDVKIGGLSLGEARRIIGLVYSEYYVNPPVIMISLATDAASTEWGFVTVMGRVVRPGRVALSSSSGVKLSEVIQQAGGFGASAKMSAIRVTRVQPGGNKIQTTIDFEQIGRQGNAAADLTLQDGDIVYVPIRKF